MNEEIKENYLLAGEIASQARKLAVKLAQPERSYFELAGEIESFIKEQNAKPAFPVNMSANEVAAHFTPLKSTKTVVGEKDLLKIDIGVHIDGCIADTAISINPDKEHRPLIDATKDALDTTLSMLKPGINLKSIGQNIQEKITSKGFLPVKNLGGHTLEQYLQHAGIFIPNVVTQNTETLEPGMVFAIEPFATNGSGLVKEAQGGNIYKYERGKARSPQERQILTQITSEFKTLPFTSRWLKLSENQARLSLTRLSMQGIIHHYPILKEAGGGHVAQSEHTVLMTEDGPIIITK